MTAMRLKRYPSPSGGIALGKMGVGATMLKQNKTARDYVQDGLVAMWDGIENAGWGVHDPNATVWKDLAGNCNFPLFGATINNESVVFNNVTSDSGMDLTNAAWLEIVFSVPSAKVFQMSFGSSGRGYLMHNNYGGVATRYASGTQFWVSSPSSGITPTNVRTHSVNVSQSNLPKGRGIYYVNGQSVNLNTTWLSSKWSSQQTAKIIGSATVSCNHLYSRALTADEIAYNYEIDKERFNLP